MIWTHVVLVSLFSLVACQYDSPVPPRPVIPGSVPLGGGGGRPVGRVRGSGPVPSRSRSFSVLDEQDIVVRPRGRQSPQSLPPQRLPRIRPQPQVIPSAQSLIAQSKPVIEDVEETPTSILDDEPLLQLVPSSPSPPRSPLLEDFPRPLQSPKPINSGLKYIDDIPISRPPPPRPQFRSSIQDEDFDIPLKQLPLEPVRGRPQYRPAPTPPQLPPQAPARGSPPRQQQLPRPNKNKLVEPLEKDEHHNRPRKPVAQVIRKYREDNEDGSITWGFENDDGTYKEETIGTDCVTRGKYGYYDPDGVRREFTYSSGIPCDKRDQLEDAEQEGSEQHGYIDYETNRYVMPNGDSIDLDNMVKNRARKPVHSQQYYRD